MDPGGPEEQSRQHPCQPRATPQAAEDIVPEHSRRSQGHSTQVLSFSIARLPYCRDLKRDVAKKLEKLEKRTQRAIAELIRKRSLASGVLPSAVA